MKFQSYFDEVQVRRLRKTYCQAEIPASEREGLDGLLEEIGWARENLSEEALNTADQRFFVEVFGGQASLRVLTALCGRAPTFTAQLFARLSPTLLNFLVGEIAHHGHGRNTISRCKFRELGGETFCEEVCRVPTQNFTESHLVPLRLTPTDTGLGCEWTWGEGASDA